MSKKVVVFEPNMNSYPHSEINAGLLSVIEEVFHNDTLYFIADSRHVSAVSQKMSMDNWSVKKIKAFRYIPRNFFINDLLLILKFTWILLYFKKNETRIYLFLGILPLSHVFISALNKFLNRNVVICLHGQMESYVQNTKVGHSRYYYYLSKSVFKWKDHLRYIVFGESIRSNLKFLFDDLKKMIVIDQPYLFPCLNDRHLNPKEEQFVFGLIGRGDKGKNVEEVFDLVRQLKVYVESNRIRIKVVGKMNVKIPDDLIGLIESFSETISKEVFENEIATLDFVLNFTDKNFYKVTPSGTFFDSVKWEKPILSLDNDFVMHYFLKYGTLGEIFESTQSMSSWIKENLIFKNLDKHYYDRIQHNFVMMKSDISIESIARKFQAQL